MKKVLFLAFVAVLISGCTAYGSEDGAGDESSVGGIRGSVVVNGEPVNSAAVLLTPGGGTKITGSDGMYNFADLQPGTYELKIYKEGFQSYNKSISVSAGKDEELAITLTQCAGKLSINKAYIDMGSNESNNLAGFSISNSGDTELAWQVTNAVGWITQIEPQTGTVSAGGSESVVFTIDRSKLSANSSDNYASLIVRSTTAGDGSVAELLVTVFGIGDGTNTAISKDDDYVIIDGLCIQTKDLGGTMAWAVASATCKSSNVGGYNDWTLPTIGELSQLYTKKEVIGNFEPGAYWSSSLQRTNYYYTINFKTGSQNYDYNSDGYKRRCRCVRTSSPLPVVSTSAATNVGETYATLNGKIVNKGEPAYTERGFVYSNVFQTPSVDDDESTTTKKVVSGTGDEFSANVSGLTTNSTYHVRAYTINSNGVVYGSTINFTPKAVLPGLSTEAVSNINVTSATLNGKIVSVGNPAYIERGFVYGTMTNPTIDSDIKKIVSGTGTGVFTANLTGLTEGAVYYVKAYASTDKTTVYGAQVSFTPSHPDYITIGALMIQRADISSSAINWTSAKTLCESSNVGGHTDWRLPTLTELAMIYTNRVTIGAFKTSYSYYWSSTLYKTGEYSQINFDTGSQSYAPSSSSYYYSYYYYYYARCVRTL